VLCGTGFLTEWEDVGCCLMTSGQVIDSPTTARLVTVEFAPNVARGWGAETISIRLNPESLFVRSTQVADGVAVVGISPEGLGMLAGHIPLSLQHAREPQIGSSVRILRHCSYKGIPRTVCNRRHLISESDRVLRYDMALGPTPGLCYYASSGAPVLDDSNEIVALHQHGTTDPSTDTGENHAASIQAIVGSLLVAKHIADTKQITAHVKNHMFHPGRLGQERAPRRQALEMEIEWTKADQGAPGALQKLAKRDLQVDALALNRSQAIWACCGRASGSQGCISQVGGIPWQCLPCT